MPLLSKEGQHATAPSLAMKTRLLFVSVASFALGMPLEAQVPQIINCQGRVTVGTVNFDGSGQFKFALVNAPGTTTFWSNDGTSAAGSEPISAVSLPVIKGLYSVPLGDTAITNMTSIQASVFSNSDVHLRVWFNDGNNGFELLTPDQRIAAVGYAMMAGTVPDGSITSSKIVAGAVGGAQLAAGAVQASNISDGAVGSSQLAAGGTVLSLNPSDPALLSQGFVQVSSPTLALSVNGNWGATSTTSAPAAREQGQSAIWTGTEMIIWGGGTFATNTWLNTGGRYNPSTDSWLPTSTTGAPSVRTHHTAVWTGTEMIVWGGSDSAEHLATGARYNPTSDTWTTISNLNAPTGRGDHGVVWTGSEMIVWGGYPYTNTGARYNPSTDSWTTMTMVNAPEAQANPGMVWTGTEMIVFGGGNGSIYVIAGRRYNPANDTWTATATLNAPEGRRVWGISPSTAVWTGSEMFVWGGARSTDFQFLSTGARYNPSTDTWSSTSTINAPAARDFHGVVWTGSQVLVWGGAPNNGTNLGGTPINTGGQYLPAADAWIATPVTGAPTGRRTASTVWTGTEMIVWGGFDGSTPVNTGARFTPSRPVYVYLKQ